jgi:hypothetical protein
VYKYCAYDLTLRSGIPLPELEVLAEGIPEVDIELGPIDWRPSTTPPDGSCFETKGPDTFLFWDTLGTFQVTGGRRILIDRCTSASDALLRLPLLGAVLATLLHQRGLLVLHASAVEIDGRSIVFIGNKGDGKSTTAAALYARGHCFIADDIVAIRSELDGSHTVLPGFPQFKLMSEAVLPALCEDPIGLPKIATGADKRTRRLTGNFARQPVPLGGLCSLSFGDELRIEKLSVQRSILNLIANTYVARFGRQLIHDELAETHLQNCVSLLRRTSMHDMTRPRNFGMLPALTEMLESEFGNRMAISMA